MVLRIVGRVFIAAGVLILLFLAYQLFGTNLITKQHQRALAADLDRQIAGEPAVTGPQPDLGDGIARIQIPKIDLNWIVVEGVSVGALKKGPGHFPGTAYSGEKGNFVVSGHRTTYGAPFFRLNELAPGDVIRVTAATGIHTYRVTSSQVVRPTDLSVIQPTEDARLTLTTCEPRFSAAKRLIITAALDEKEELRNAA